MQIARTKVVPVEVKELKIHLKVSDRFTAVVKDTEGETLLNYEGYVPSFMPGDHFGDYVILNIDLDTGMITNWKKPTSQQMEAFINEKEDES